MREVNEKQEISLLWPYIDKHRAVRLSHHLKVKVMITTMAR